MKPTGAISSFSLFVGIAISGCSGDGASPEQQVREALRQAEEAAEAREQGFFGDFVAEDYSDSMGRDRAAFLGLTRLYFVRNRSIHILSRVEEIDFPIPSLARVSLLAGLAGQDEAADSQWSLRADVYRFELDLRQAPGGEWKLIRAQWRQGAGPER